MIIVIQCAGSKASNAGTIKHDGQSVSFVARPHLATPVYGTLFARPDDVIPGESRTWRDLILETNANKASQNGLLQAADLYRHPAYARLKASIPLTNIFILSAGWGLVRGDFRLPDYDITFSSSADSVNRRLESDSGFLDFNQLPNATFEPGEEIHFFGGSSYLPLFIQMAGSLQCRKVIHFKSEKTRLPEGFDGTQHFGTITTNWHYSALTEFLSRKGT
ncbi:MAG: hypothetical protein IPK50_19495 [Fibrobacterota bacterium]|nr:MAG: hypothetical protein IPK50_19495 [Fibrobacterota bacterium]